jgi:hypothetical protein
MNNSKALNLMRSAKMVHSDMKSELFFDLSKVRSKAIYVCKPSEHHKKLLKIKYGDTIRDNKNLEASPFFYEDDSKNEIRNISNSVSSESDCVIEDELLSLTRCSSSLLNIHESFAIPFQYRAPQDSSANRPVLMFLLKIIVQRRDYSYWEDHVLAQLNAKSGNLTSSSSKASKGSEGLYYKAPVLAIYTLLPLELS